MADKAMTPIEWLTQFYTKWDLEENNVDLPMKKTLADAKQYYGENNLEREWFDEMKKNARHFNQHFLKNRALTGDGSEKKPYPPDIEESARAPARAPAPAPAPAPLPKPAPAAEPMWLVELVVDKLIPELDQLNLQGYDVRQAATRERLKGITLKIMKQTRAPPNGGWSNQTIENQRGIIEQLKEQVMDTLLKDTEDTVATADATAFVRRGGGRSTRRRRRKNKASTKKKVRKSSKRRRRKRKYRTRKYRTRR
jgi:hypothetical protein